MNDIEKRLQELRKLVDEERQEFDDSYEPTDTAFTVEVTTNDNYYIEHGGAPKHRERDCCGYVALAFDDDADSVALMAQGKTNLTLLVSSLLSLYSAKQIRKALAKAMAKKFMEGELSAEDVSDMFSSEEK